MRARRSVRCWARARHSMRCTFPEAPCSGLVKPAFWQRFCACPAWYAMAPGTGVHPAHWQPYPHLVLRDLTHPCPQNTRTCSRPSRLSSGTPTEPQLLSGASDLWFWDTCCASSCCRLCSLASGVCIRLRASASERGNPCAPSARAEQGLCLVASIQMFMQQIGAAAAAPLAADLHGHRCVGLCGARMPMHVTTAARSSEAATQPPWQKEAHACNNISQEQQGYLPSPHKRAHATATYTQPHLKVAGRADEITQLRLHLCRQHLRLGGRVGGLRSGCPAGRLVWPGASHLAQWGGGACCTGARGCRRSGRCVVARVACEAQGGCSAAGDNHARLKCGPRTCAHVYRFLRECERGHAAVCARAVRHCTCQNVCACARGSRHA